MSLACRRDNLRFGDTVLFQVDIDNRASNVIPCGRKRRATVDFIKGMFVLFCRWILVVIVWSLERYVLGSFGFLSYELIDGKKLIFYTSEVRASSPTLQIGDMVEFTLYTNQRTGKMSACNISKIRCCYFQYAHKTNYFKKILHVCFKLKFYYHNLQQ